mgnify:CR=1 FL=1|jgi:hypothetical protein
MTNIYAYINLPIIPRIKNPDGYFAWVYKYTPQLYAESGVPGVCPEFPCPEYGYK